MKTHLFHLSHTDLDGYGCQMVSNHFFDNINYYNSNYGKEIEERFLKITQDISLIEAEANTILISDLNLTMEQCAQFESKLSDIPFPTRLLLLDHHQSGEECSIKYPWYYLDSSRCATKITYDFFSDLYGKDQTLSKIVDVINSVDIWLSQDTNFELGKVCLGFLANAKEINRTMFDEENTKYMLYLLSRIPEIFGKKDSHIELDDKIHFFKKDFFKKNKPNDTLSNLVSSYVVDLIGENKQKFEIQYKTYKGVLTYNIGNVSVVGNDFLVKNPDVDFFMDVTSRKTVSFRANGNVDVSKIAAQIANGGGHANASGGVINSFKDNFLFENIKQQIVDYIKTKES